MAKGSPKLEWCIVRLGEDHNWWVDEVSDPVHWDVDGLSIIDPRQVDHIIELIDPLREYGFDQDVFERAFIPFRIAKDLGKGKVRLSRIKQPLLESEEKLFALPDVIDEENGPYADFLDHITRLRVKMLNEILTLEEKLTVDDVEDQIREAQNSDFIEGKAVHLFTEITAILEYTPEGHSDDDEDGEKVKGGDGEADVPDVEEEEDEKMKNDSSLKWDDDEDGDKDDDDGEKKKKDGDEDDDEDSDDAEEGDEKPKSSKRGR
jgi:phosphotransferase system IIB component